MKKLVPWIILALTALWVLSGLRSPEDPGAFRVADFGRVPVLLNGRIQPLNSVGRNALLLTRTRRSVSFKEAGEDGALHRRQMGATEWLLEAMTKPEAANTRPIFRVDHPDLKDLLKLPADA